LTKEKDGRISLTWHHPDELILSPMPDVKNKSARFYTLLLATTFVLSRLLFYLLGVRFDASGLDWYWQYLDVELLQNDLIRSLFYQHSQPPLFNLFLGIVLKCFPLSYTLVFAFVFKATSLALYFCLFQMLHLIGFKRWIAYAAATLFILSPGAVLYENWLFYSWPAAVLLTLCAHQLLLYEKKHRTTNALLYLAGIAAICLTRPMFHLVYVMAAIIPLMVLTPPTARKRIGAASGIAILLVGSLFLKNLLLFGFFGSSSWMGMNLWKVVPTGGKDAQLAESAVVQQAPFSPLSNYPTEFHSIPKPFYDVPALAAEEKQNSEPNLNHVGYISISEEYKRMAIKLIRSDPAGYAGIVLKAWGKYIEPARSYPLLSRPNLTALENWVMLWTPASSYLLVPLGLLLIVWSTRQVVLLGESERPALFLFCFGTVFYIAVLGNFMEHGENMRFRVQTDPLLYMAALTALLHISRRFRNQ
jgi:hypothetical protein